VCVLNPSIAAERSSMMCDDEGTLPVTLSMKAKWSFGGAEICRSIVRGVGKV